MLASWLFVLTHLDTLVVVGAFCADSDYRVREVLVGHYVGFCIGLLGAVVGAIVAAEFLRGWTFLLGLVPLGIGIRGLVHGPPEAAIEASPAVPDAAGRTGVVAAAGVGLSGENIAVYIPFFAELSPGALALVVALYVFGAGLLFLVALVVGSRVHGRLERFERWLVPAVLAVVGAYVVATGLAAPLA